MSSVTLPRLSSSLAFDFVTKRTVRFPSRLNKDKVTSGDNERYSSLPLKLHDHEFIEILRDGIHDIVDRTEDKQKRIPFPNKSGKYSGQR